MKFQCWFATMLAFAVVPAAQAQDGPAQGLPEPAEQPLAIDFTGDPVLALAAEAVSVPAFATLIAAAVRRHPLTAEADALQGEAVAELEQVQEAQRPTVEINLGTYRTLAREFGQGQGSIVERSRPPQRTDATLVVQQTLFDFGVGDARVAAAGAQIRAAAAEIESAADQVALQAVATWYEIFGLRALIGLTEAFLTGQEGLRDAIEQRIALGASAETDRARVDNLAAEGEIRRAQIRRRLATAEARFRELTGFPPPADVERAPIPILYIDSREEAAIAALTRPIVRGAEARAAAARRQAEAASREQLPQVTGSLEAGRYGVFENERDYDVRARVNARYRLFGGAEPRVRQFGARARAAEARADRVRIEAERDAAIAWADVQALEEQLEALGAAYRAARQTRDAVIIRFRAVRGTLFDVIAAEQAYFTAATAFIEGLTEFDTARFVLLSRTGQLLDRLAIRTDELGRQR